MKTFEPERTFIENIRSPKYKFPTPCVHFAPKKITKNTSVFIFVGGIGTTMMFTKMFNYPFYDEHYLVAYERLGYGENKHKSIARPGPYVDQIDIIVEFVKKKFPNKKVYLLGECGGGHLSILYYKKYQGKINGVYCWNMPSHQKDPRKKSFGYTLGLGMKMMLTIMLGVQTHDYQAVDRSELLSSNEYLIRLMKMQKSGIITDNKLSIAAWLSFKSAWKGILEHAYDETVNYIYIQTGEDWFSNKKFINKVKAKYGDSRHIRFLKKGYHILTNEEPANDALFDIISKDVNAKRQ